MISHQRIGATPEEWQWCLDRFGDRALLPVVNDLTLPISSTSSFTKETFDAKQPSRINQFNEVVGVKWSKPAVFANAHDRSNPSYGIGIRGSACCALDIDVSTESLAAAVMAAAGNYLGALGYFDFPVRRRDGSARCLIPIKVGDEIRKGKVYLTKARAAGDDAVEFLGHAQYWNAAGTHKSGQRYRMDGAEHPIPELTAAQVRELLDHIADAVRDLAECADVVWQKEKADPGEARSVVAGRGPEELEDVLKRCQPADDGPTFRAQLWALALTWPDERDRIEAWAIDGNNGYEEDEFDRNWRTASLQSMPNPSIKISKMLGVVIEEDFADMPPAEKPRVPYKLAGKNPPRVISDESNHMLFLEHDLGLDLRYDTFASRCEMNGKEYSPDVDWHPISVMWARRLDANGRFKKTEVTSAVYAMARQREYDSCAEWMKQLPSWDGADRVSTFWQDCAGTDDDPAYLAALGRYFFSLLAGRMRYAGDRAIKGDCVPVLSGPQGTRKSSLVQALAPFPDWYASAALTLPNADWCRSMSGKSIGEIEEMRGYKSDEQAKKARLSALVDEWAPKFKEELTLRARHYALIGTFNPDNGSGFLTDFTGNRRYAPISVTRLCDTDRARANLPQLLAQGLALFDQSGVHWVELDKHLLDGKVHAGHMVKCKDHDAIVEFLECYGGAYITKKALCEAIGMSTSPGNNEERLRTAAAASVGWEYAKRRPEGDFDMPELSTSDGRIWAFWSVR